MGKKRRRRRNRKRSRGEEEVGGRLKPDIYLLPFMKNVYQEHSDTDIL